jgi:hypothetical protein
METFWASSREEKEKIVERIISDYSYENRPINLQTGINIPKTTAGILIDAVGVELSDENPRVIISYGQSTVAMGPLSWGLVSDLHEIAHLPWGKDISAGAGAVFTAFTSLTSPINAPTPYTYMTYEDLLGEFKNLKSENDYFREQLSAINSSQKLQKYSLFYGFLSILSLVFTNFLKVNLIHPILAYFAFCTSTFFYLMGVLMERQETKKCSGKE